MPARFETEVLVTVNEVLVTVNCTGQKEIDGNESRTT